MLVLGRKVLEEVVLQPPDHRAVLAELRNALATGDTARAELLGDELAKRLGDPCEIVVRVLGVDRNRCSLGFAAPAEVSVCRRELLKPRKAG